MLKYVVSICLLILSACVTPAQKFGGWRGQNIDTAVSHLGAPTHVTEISTGKVYEWTKTGSVSATGSTFYGVQNVDVDQKRCTLRLTADQSGTITVVSWDGNDC